jgi:hypothetical protein
MPPFDLGRPCPSDSPDRVQATGGGETAGRGGAQRRFAGGSSALLDLELWASVLSAEQTYT